MAVVQTQPREPLAVLVAVVVTEQQILVLLVVPQPQAVKVMRAVEGHTAETKPTLVQVEVVLVPLVLMVQVFQAVQVALV